MSEPSSRKTIYVVTHTQSVHHVERRVGGWYDTPLTDKGRHDARLIADRLRDLVVGSEVEIFCSDLRRAAQTAEAIAERFGIRTVSMPGLREAGHGVAEGMPEEWLRGRETAAPPENRMDHRRGIENAETRRDVALRVYGAVEEIVGRACASQIIVTHGFAFTFVVAAWLKLPIDGLGFIHFRATPGGITHLEDDGLRGSRTLARLNCTSHLER